MNLTCQRPYSIRTRIKTEPGFARDLSLAYSQRPYSIRTRIKTPPNLFSKASHLTVRDHIPLEQGLRPKMTDAYTFVAKSETIFH